MLSMLLTLLFSGLAFFSVSMSVDFPCTAHAFFPERLSNHCQGLRHTYFYICAKFDAVPLLDPMQNHIRLDTRLQIKGHKNQHIHAAAWNRLHWLPQYGSTVIYCCITLLQLLHRWQHQSQKLWITFVI
jgi:hypothetical protein